MKNKEAGITLIALVVTIIVLLILAGISIQMLTGDNGILKRAGEAKEETVEGSLEEQVKLIIMDRKSKDYLNENQKALEEDLKKEFSGENEVTQIEGIDDLYYVTQNGETITVYEDGTIEKGKVEVWDGSSENSPELKKENDIWKWYIYTPSQLKFLANFVNNENKLTDNQKILVRENGYNADEITMTENSTVYLMKNLDLGARITKTETANGIIITKKTGEDWTPIGIDNQSKKFIGKFEGQNHYIKGIYINSNSDYVGLFGTASNTIKDLTIKDSYIKGSSKVGGIVGYHYGNSNTIDNCTNNAMVCGKQGVGGIVGGSNSGIITNCINNGRIQACLYCGGIAGYLKVSKALNCTNTGLIKFELIDGYNSYKQDFGGICGLLSDKGSEISRSYNSGDIEGALFSGGIVGRILNQANLIECYSKGNVDNTLNQEKNVGEIIGYIYIGENEIITIDKVYYLENENQNNPIGATSGTDIYSQNIESLYNNFNSLKDFLRMVR